MGVTQGTARTSRLGVCSWSLRPVSARDLAEKVRVCHLDAVQVALEPLRAGRMGVDELRAALAAAGIEARSGMLSPRGEDYSTPDSIRRTGGFRSDEHWPRNLDAALQDARLARELGLPLVTFHAGFLPHEPGDGERVKLLGRLRTVVDVFANEGVRAGFETGQETAETLLAFLTDLDRPAAGVNFDPANMILYGMGDPVAALRLLAPRVVQVHVKDAIAPKTRGSWGEDVPVGTGHVDWKAFFAVLRAEQPGVDLMIEREAGDARVADVRRACAHVLAARAGA